MKPMGVVVGLGILAAVGGVAYAMSSKGTTLEHGGVYTWVDKRGFGAAETKAQYESLGFASVSIIQTADGWGIQAIWNGTETVWDVPDGLTKPQYEGHV